MILIRSWLTCSPDFLKLRRQRGRRGSAKWPLCLSPNTCYAVATGPLHRTGSWPAENIHSFSIYSSDLCLRDLSSQRVSNSSLEGANRGGAPPRSRWSRTLRPRSSSLSSGKWATGSEIYLSGFLFCAFLATMLCAAPYHYFVLADSVSVVPGHLCPATLSQTSVCNGGSSSMKRCHSKLKVLVHSDYSRRLWAIFWELQNLTAHYCLKKNYHCPTAKSCSIDCLLGRSFLL